ACSRATCCSRACGATRPIATRAPSTSTSGTCARSWSATRRSRSTSSPCAGSATASATPTTDARVRTMRSLRNRLAFLFFAITLAAIGVLYLYVVPQLQSRLRDEKLSQLEASAKQTVDRIADTVGADLRASRVREAVGGAADAANARI